MHTRTDQFRIQIDVLLLFDQFVRLPNTRFFLFKSLLLPATTSADSITLACSVLLHCINLCDFFSPLIEFETCSFLPRTQLLDAHFLYFFFVPLAIVSFFRNVSIKNSFTHSFPTCKEKSLPVRYHTQIYLSLFCVCVSFD